MCPNEEGRKNMNYKLYNYLSKRMLKYYFHRHPLYPNATGWYSETSNHLYIMKYIELLDKIYESL